MSKKSKEFYRGMAEGLALAKYRVTNAPWFAGKRLLVEDIQAEEGHYSELGMSRSAKLTQIKGHACESIMIDDLTQLTTDWLDENFRKVKDETV